MLLTSVLQVDENACRTTHISPDAPLAMLDMARARSPRCSMKRKNMNHVDTDTVCCIIVHEHTGIMDLSSALSKVAGLSNPYLLLSHPSFV